MSENPKAIPTSQWLILGCAGMMFACSIAAVVGAVLVWVLLGWTAPAPPGPVPPAPAPQPSPNQFLLDVQRVFQEENGSQDDAAILAAAFRQLSDTLIYDGQQQTPQIGNANDLGNAFARMQRNRFLSDQTPFADKYPKLELRISSEMNSRNIVAGTLDNAKRQAAADLFREVGDALYQLQAK